MKGKGGAIFYALIFMTVLNLAVVGSYYLRAPVTKPLADYSPQMVSNELPGLDGPAVIMGQPATVSGTRCNISDEDLQVTYVYSWKLDEPDSTVSVPASSGTRTFASGCENRNSAMTMPPGVVDISKSYFEKGATVVKWHIEAIETPIDADGNLGQIKTWKTNTFGVYPQ